MAGVLVDYTIAEQALVAATAETILELKNAAHHRYKLLEFNVSFDGVVVTAEPVVVELCRINSTGGDGTSSALTGLKRDGSLPETVQTTALNAFTAEPTTVNVLRRFEVHPQGSFNWQAPFGQEYQFGGATAGADSGRVALRCTAPVAVNVCASMSIEE
jgi:hypothetical protein